MTYTDIENAVQKSEQRSGITLRTDQKALVWAATEIIFHAREDDDFYGEFVQKYIDTMLKLQMLMDGFDEQAQEIWKLYNRGFDEEEQNDIWYGSCGDDYFLIEKNLDIYIEYSGIENLSKSQRVLLKLAIAKDQTLDEILCVIDDIVNSYYTDLKELNGSMDPDTRKVFRAILIEQEAYSPHCAPFNGTVATERAAAEGSPDLTFGDSGR